VLFRAVFRAVERLAAALRRVPVERLAVVLRVAFRAVVRLAVDF